MMHTTTVYSDSSYSPVEEIYGPDPGVRRPLMSMAEYEKQGREVTAEELKKASLYWMHHGATKAQCGREFLREVSKTRIFWACVIGVVAILIGTACFSSSYQEYDGHLVPLSFPQRVLHLPLEFVDMLRELTGHTRKGLPGSDSFAFKKPPSPTTSTPTSYTPPRSNSAQGPKDNGSNNNNSTTNGSAVSRSSHAQDEGRAQLPPKQYEEGQHTEEQQQPQANELVESSFASLFRGSNQQGGMNIFTFAYAAAVDFASSLYAFAFGSA